MGEGTQMPTGPLRLLRLLRMSCMARLLRALLELLPRPKGELLPKATGIYVGACAVGQSLLMMALFLYALAIVMHMISKKNPCVNNNFSVPLCMWTLPMKGTPMDCTGYAIVLYCAAVAVSVTSGGWLASL